MITGFEKFSTSALASSKDYILKLASDFEGGVAANGT